MTLTEMAVQMACAPTVWLAGRLNYEAREAAGAVGALNPVAWELLGLYHSEASAEARCRTPRDFVWEAPFGDYPEHRLEMPGCRFPLAAPSEPDTGLSAPQSATGTEDETAASPASETNLDLVPLDPDPDED